MSKLTHLIIVCCLLSLAGCSSCNVKDATKIPTHCLAIDHAPEVKTDIKNKKAYLAKLDAEVDTLTDELTDAEMQLSKLSETVDKLEIPEKELAKLKQDISAMQQQQNQLFSDIYTSKEEIARLNKAIAESKRQQPELNQQLKAQEAKVSKMHKKMQIVKNDIKRTIALRQRQE